VLTGGRAVTERRCDGEEDRQWLELVAREKEGARELGSKGERGGEGWVLGGLYRGWGHRGGVTAGGNGGVMALTPLKVGAG
jgi:hypothetical protein